MARITSAHRNSLPSRQFGLPGVRKYPVDTRARAEDAKSRADQMFEDGKLSHGEYETVVRKANEKLGKR